MSLLQTFKWVNKHFSSFLRFRFSFPVKMLISSSFCLEKWSWSSVIWIRKHFHFIRENKNFTFHWSVCFVNVCIVSYLSQTLSFVIFVQIFRDMPSSASGPTNMQLNLPRRRSAEVKAPSCSERPLTLFHTPTHSQKGEHVISLLEVKKCYWLLHFFC